MAAMNGSFLASSTTEFKKNKCDQTQSKILLVSLYTVSLVCLFNFPSVAQGRNYEVSGYLVAFLKKCGYFDPSQ